MFTSGSCVFGSKACSGFLISLPFSSESSSSTKKRCTRADWFGAASPSRTTMPRGTLNTMEPAGGPPEPSASSSGRHWVPFAYFCGGPPARLVVGQQALAGGRRVVIALHQRLAVGADRIAVGAEQVVAVGGRAVVLLVGLLRREVRARRHVGLLGLRLLLLRELRGVVERLRAGERHVRPVRVEHVRLPVVELELRGGAHLLDRALRVLHARQADRDLVAAGALDLGLGDAERVGALADRLERVVERLLA